ncbi:related to RNA polymerase II transcription factor B subunit 1 [Saccharomycodes ludwigii]|uniref:Related to RNA polymerase II transcription factor B subunit 1 n=1 Tax=Saccharomycodes ludwigii TaxID=36035 RepID=A0A376B3D5_9ASCO|nr:related to RNA polymerase II transcription factor B subunit 1 [Saccharomycodes ludwigii]
MSHSGAAIFKKVSGMITVDEDASPATLIWRSTDGDKIHKVSLNAVDKLQATPSTSDKMMLRLVLKEDPNKKRKTNGGDGAPVKGPVTTFQFNNRIVMDNIKNTLQTIISRYKDNELYREKLKQKENFIPKIQTPLIDTAQLDDSLSTSNLLSNLELQQTLLKHNKGLFKKFQETVINSSLPPKEFWSTRIPELRAFALTTSQKLGPYNVLSTIKPVASSDNKVNVSVSRDKILTILHNYPIVKKAFDDSVPKNFSEQEFWARFFSSKLFRKLRGERIMANDRGDIILDRYLKLDQEFDTKDDKLLIRPVRKTIDLEGNFQDDPELLGNTPDFTMKSGVDINGRGDGVVDILRGMNRLSEKMIKSLETEYSRPISATAQHTSKDDGDVDEADIGLIRDLEEVPRIEYSEIHLKQKHKPVENLNEVNDTESYEVVLKHVSKVQDILSTKLDLTKVGDENCDEANRRIVNAIKINAKQYQSVDVQENLTATYDIPTDLLESCRILNDTCCEFLKHFYIHYQSGNPKESNIVRRMYEDLQKCLKKLEKIVKLDENCSKYLASIIETLHFTINKYETS